ncbi:hypothetical protein B7463_g9244, partial [Scytalidium lignicola]
MVEAEDRNQSGLEQSNMTIEISSKDNSLDSTSVVQATSARMLLNSKGERVYIGEGASLSFLQFLRRSIRQYMGPSLFTQSNRRNIMLEADPGINNIEEFVEDTTHKQLLVDCYFSVTSGLLDLYTRNEVSMLLAGECKASSDDTAALSLMIAIGGQCRGIDSIDRQYAIKYFSQGQRAAFEGMLQDPSLNMVRMFILMAFYMFGACRRNAATMYIGVASKAACTLGLHVADQYRIFDKDEQNVRFRIWKSLCNLNVTVTSILGRNDSPGPSCVQLDAFNNLPNILSDTEDMQQRLAHAVFSACSITQDIVQYLYTSRNVDITSAKKCLKQLGQWKSSLPNEVCGFTQPSGTTISPVEQALVIGNIHVACVYYFSVILITRSFLISHLMLHLRRRAEQDLATTEEPSEYGDIFRLSQVCIDATIYLAQMCNDAIQSGFFLGNMCIIKAWVFAAGLVLGFSIFAEGEFRWDMEEAFASACAVLKTLAKLSPQAEHYRDILTQLSDAINNYRQQLAFERRHSNEQYVSRILTISVAPTLDLSSTPSVPQSADTLEDDAAEVGTFEIGAEMGLDWDQMDFGLGFAIGNWDVLDLQLPVDFPIGSDDS